MEHRVLTLRLPIKYMMKVLGKSKDVACSVDLFHNRRLKWKFIEKKIQEYFMDETFQLSKIEMCKYSNSKWIHQETIDKEVA